MKQQGCSSEILNLTPKGDHLGVAKVFVTPKGDQSGHGISKFFIPKRDRLKTNNHRSNAVNKTS